MISTAAKHACLPACRVILCVQCWRKPRIGRSDSINCYFCNNLPETILHLFCECEKVSPFGMNYVFWLIIFLGNPLLSQILKKCLVSQTSQNMTIVLMSSFYAWNFVFIDANFSKPTPNFVAFLNLVKIKRNTEYKIAESKGKLRQHFKKWTLNLEAS